MYHSEWHLFEDKGDLFLLCTGTPFVFEVDQANLKEWTWSDLKAFLTECLEGHCPESQKSFPTKPQFYEVWELSQRLSHSSTLVEWVGDVGHIKSDDLPDVVIAFLQQVDVPTYQAREDRLLLKKQGFDFDGAWAPSTIKYMLDIFSRTGLYPADMSDGSWLFRERVTAKNGALVSLYEITRSGWGFSLKGLDQQSTIREFEAFLSVWVNGNN